MSATNIIVQRDAAHVITDGARYNEHGILLGIGPKCEALPHLPALMTLRGPSLAAPIILDQVAFEFATFDALLDGIEESLGRVVDSYADLFATTSSPDIELYLVGYSASRERFAAYTIQTGGLKRQLHAVDQVGGVDVDAMLSPEPLTLTEMDDAVIAPCLSASTVSDILRGRSDPDQLDPVRDGIAFLQAQRQLKLSLHPGGPLAHHVGGFAMLSTVTREGTTQRIIHRWPEDRIGSPIEPAGVTFADVGAAPPVGMSRLQREMSERRQRKALKRAGAR